MLNDTVVLFVVAGCLASFGFWQSTRGLKYGPLGELIVALGAVCYTVGCVLNVNGQQMPLSHPEAIGMYLTLGVFAAGLAMCFGALGWLVRQLLRMRDMSYSDRLSFTRGAPILGFVLIVCPLVTITMMSVSYSGEDTLMATVIKFGFFSSVEQVALFNLITMSTIAITSFIFCGEYILPTKNRPNAAQKYLFKV